jgi:hypothetical protein
LNFPCLFAAGRHLGFWSDHAALTDRLLGDDPITIITAITAAAGDGASPADVGQTLAYAAALRVARFGTANEHSDWETAHHVWGVRALSGTRCRDTVSQLVRIIADQLGAGFTNSFV